MFSLVTYASLTDVQTKEQYRLKQLGYKDMMINTKEEFVQKSTVHAFRTFKSIVD